MQDMINFLSELQEFEQTEEMKKMNIDLNESYKIMDESQADFFLKQYSDYSKDLEEMNAACDKKIEEYTATIEKFREEKTKTIKNQLEYFSSLLQQYLETYLANNNTKKKSLKLPFGTLAMKKSRAKLNIENEKELLQFLEQNDQKQFIKTKTTESLDKTALNAKIEEKEDGVYVGDIKLPNTTLEKAIDQFSIKLNE